MKLQEVPFWMHDRDCLSFPQFLDREVLLDWTETQEHTRPFDDVITFMMVPLYMKVGACAFPPVIMAPSHELGSPGYRNGWSQLTGAHRLRAAFFAGIERIPAYLVQPLYIP